MSSSVSPQLRAIVILGSGLSGCYAPQEVQALDQAGDPRVEGHSCRTAIVGSAHGEVLVAFGRRHLYEGVDAHAIGATIASARLRGASVAVVTNAAGGLHPLLEVGDVMLITDVMGVWLARALRSLRIDGQRRGRPLSDALATDCYEGIELRSLACGVSVRRGTYAAVSGPSYETRAEVRMLRRLGADAVGMSTLPELAIAAQLGMRCVGLSLITNTASDTASTPVAHGDVLEAGVSRAAAVRAVIDASLDALADV